MCKLPYGQHRADEGSALLEFLCWIQDVLFPLVPDIAQPLWSQELLRQQQLNGPALATFAPLPIGCFTVMEVAL